MKGLLLGITAAFATVVIVAHAQESIGPQPTFTSSVTLTSGQFLAPDGTASAPSYSFASQNTLGFYKVATDQIGVTRANGNTPVLIYSGGVALQSAGQFSFVSSNNAATGSIDTTFNRVGAGVLGIGNTSTADGTLNAAKILVTSTTGGNGYGVGSGGTVTQLTSRTTGVTLSKPTGQITMFSAAGSALAASFTVTNTTIAATDTVILSQASGTNLYEFFVTAVAAGSFKITFFTTGGTATDAPVINFTVIKGSAS